MTARIRPIGMLKKYTADQTEIQVESGKTVLETLDLLRIPTEIVALVLVNQKHQNKDYIIQEDDLIQLMAVIGGG
jgi:sulfur carrier protein ThiS